MPFFVKLKRLKIKPEKTFKDVNEWIDGILEKIEQAFKVNVSGNITLSQSSAGLHLNVPGFPIALAKTGASGIAARSGSTLSSGAITLQLFNVNTGTISADPASTTDKAFNFSAATGGVGASKYVIVIKIFGVWFVIAEEC